MSGHDDRLSGWKELAEYLRRSVRSVQRWERELGLPVRRMRTKSGQAIYASRAEVDAWLARTQLPPAEHDLIEPDEPHEAPEVPLPAAPAHPTVGRWPIVAALLLIGAVVLSMASAFLWRGGPRSLSSKVTVRGQQIEGWSRAGKLVWTVDLPADSRRVPFEQVTRAAPLSDSHADVRLSPDAQFAHVVPVRANSSDEFADRSDSLHVISDSGTVLWTWAPEFSLVCGGSIYEGPWRMTSMAVSSASGEKVIWVAYTHHTWWPSVVFEVSAEGTSRLRYVQSGWVMSLAEVTTSQGQRLVAGGVLNDLARPSVAFLDLSREGVALYDPINDAFDCAVESAVRPARVLAMPTTETTMGEGGPYSIVGYVRRVSDAVYVEYSQGDLTMHVDLNERAIRFAFTDLYWERHARQSATRVINHSGELCPWLAKPAEIREWTPATGWTTYEVPVDERSRPPAR